MSSGGPPVSEYEKMSFEAQTFWFCWMEVDDVFVDCCHSRTPLAFGSFERLLKQNSWNMPGAGEDGFSQEDLRRSDWFTQNVQVFDQLLPVAVSCSCCTLCNCSNWNAEGSVEIAQILLDRRALVHQVRKGGCRLGISSHGKTWPKGLQSGAVVPVKCHCTCAEFRLKKSERLSLTTLELRCWSFSDLGRLDSCAHRRAAWLHNANGVAAHSRKNELSPWILSRRNASESLSLAGGLPALCFIGYLFAIWLGIRNIVLRSVELAGSYQQTACDVYDLIQKKWTRCLQETFGCLDICGQEDHMICSEKDFQTLWSLQGM